MLATNESDRLTTQWYSVQVLWKLKALVKGNVAVYKDLNIEFVTKKSFCYENASVRMQFSHIAHVRIAYFTHGSGMILYAMAIERVELQ